MRRVEVVGNTVTVDGQVTGRMVEAIPVSLVPRRYRKDAFRVSSSWEIIDGEIYELGVKTRRRIGRGKQRARIRARVAATGSTEAK